MSAGPDGSGTVRATPAIVAQPDKEARIVSRRVAEWQQNMVANLERVRSLAEG